MPRLFAAIEVTDETADALMDLEQPLPGARWLAADDFHLTLRFFGDVSNSAAREIADALAGIDLPMFELRLRGVNVFGAKEPHSIWVGVEPNPMLTALQAATERAARIAGFAPETRGYTPHVTIARLKRPRDEGIARYLTRNGRFTCPPFPVPRFALFSSKPKVGGGPYVIEEVFGLRGGSWDDTDDQFGPFD
ncbi:MAG: RNA 2',3'-cyclic phosphodiesterase [Hyphomicrobiaceae bacterium]